MLQMLSPEILAPLGWALLNSIWQMGFLWLVYLVLTGNYKRFQAATRHNLALLFSGLGFGWFLFSLLTANGHSNSEMDWSSVTVFSQEIFLKVNSLIPYLSMIYLSILCLRAGQYLFRVYQGRIAKRSSVMVFSEPLQAFGNRISQLMGIRKPLRIFLSDWVVTAQTSGYLKPLILLPVALVNRLTLEQVETILIHELVHIRRNDFLVNLVMTVFRFLFFFNPFARLFFITVSREREQACDDGVMQWGYPPRVYAEALFSLEKFRQLPRSLSLAANGNNPGLLMERILRVVGHAGPGKNPFTPLLSFSLIAAVFIFTLNFLSPFPNPDAAIQPQVRQTAIANTVLVSTIQKTMEPPIQEINNRAVPENGSATPLLKDHPQPGEIVYRKTAKVNRAITSSIIPNHKPDPVALEQMDEEKTLDHLRYVEHNEVRNYSNERAAEPELPVEADLEGGPYVPSASFSYQATGDTLIPDQHLELLLQNKLKALVALGKIKTITLRKNLDAEIRLKMKDLKRMELENRKLMEQKQKDLQPVLRKMKEDMQSKKAEIDRLRMQLTGEVIYI